MKVRGTKAHVAAWVELTLAKELNAVAESLGISRSEAVRLALTQFVMNESNNNDREENG